MKATIHNRDTLARRIMTKGRTMRRVEFVAMLLTGFGFFLLANRNIVGGLSVSIFGNLLWIYWAMYKGAASLAILNLFMMFAAYVGLWRVIS